MDFEKRHLNFLKALNDETRLKLVLVLLKNEYAATSLVPVVNKAQPTVSLNLKQLELCGIVTSSHKGKNIFYTINDRAKEIIEKVFSLLGIDKELDKQKINFLKAISDNTRIKIILHILSNEKVKATDFPIGVAQPTISLNLKLLENNGIVESERKGQSIFYSLSDNRVKQIFELVKYE